MWPTRLILLLVGVLNPFLTSTSANGQTVNGHQATAIEVAVLATHGITQGNWHVDGWGIVSLDRTPAEPQTPHCHFVLDVPLDCNVVVASR